MQVGEVRMGSNGHQSGYEGDVKKWPGERAREKEGRSGRSKREGCKCVFVFLFSLFASVG